MHALFFLPFLILLITPASAIVRVQDAEDSAFEPRIDLACSFLQSLYNSTLGLVKETPSSTVYHIASDNILAENALARCPSSSARSMSQAISNAIKGTGGNGYDGKHEAAFGAAITLPIQDMLARNISVTPSNQIVTETRNATSTVPFCNSGDVEAYTVLELVREKDQTGAQVRINCLNRMYNGSGIVDNATLVQHQYQTFKNALYILALASMKQSPPGGLVENIVRMQGADGGIHTGYDRFGTYNGTLENAETTSMVILAFAPVRTVPCLVWWLLLAGAIILLGIATILIITIILPARRRTKLSKSVPA